MTAEWEHLPWLPWLVGNCHFCCCCFVLTQKSPSIPLKGHHPPTVPWRKFRPLRLRVEFLAVFYLKQQHPLLQPEFSTLVQQHLIFMTLVRKPSFLGQRLLVYPGLFSAHTFYPSCVFFFLLFFVSSSKARNICQLICHYKSRNKKVFFMFMTHFYIIGTWREIGRRELRALWLLIIQGCQIPRWDVRLPWRLHLLKRSFCHRHPREPRRVSETISQWYLCLALLHYLDFSCHCRNVFVCTFISIPAGVSGNLFFKSSLWWPHKGGLFSGLLRDIPVESECQGSWVVKVWAKHPKHSVVLPRLVCLLCPHTLFLFLLRKNPSVFNFVISTQIFNTARISYHLEVLVLASSSPQILALPFFGGLLLSLSLIFLDHRVVTSLTSSSGVWQLLPTECVWKYMLFTTLEVLGPGRMELINEANWSLMQ